MCGSHQKIHIEIDSVDIGITTAVLHPPTNALNMYHRMELADEQKVFHGLLKAMRDCFT